MVGQAQRGGGRGVCVSHVHRGGRRRNVPVSASTWKDPSSFRSRTNKQVTLPPGSSHQQRLPGRAQPGGGCPGLHTALQWPVLLHSQVGGRAECLELTPHPPRPSPCRNPDLPPAVLGGAQGHGKQRRPSQVMGPCPEARELQWLLLVTCGWDEKGHQPGGKVSAPGCLYFKMLCVRFPPRFDGELFTDRELLSRHESVLISPTGS